MDGQRREPNGAPGIAEDRAFVDSFEVGPTASGTLDGLSFVVKDLIDIGGHVTGCGNPDWRDTHAPAAANAVCVEQLLDAGARCVGKAVTDELAFSLLGENHFYGTPLNPRPPTGFPGDLPAVRRPPWPKD
jgi:amidase